MAHHVYEGENDRFLDLKNLSAADQARLTERYEEEFSRYMGLGDSLEPDSGNAIRSATLTRKPVPQ